MNGIALIVALLLAQGASQGASQGGVVIPPPRGLVNDFAGVIDAAHAARIEAIAAHVRAQSGGEIAVVTLADLGGRDVADVALRIGREWGVGARAAVGDRRRNAGVVILVVPKEQARDGRGRVYIAVGQGAEGFIPDGGAGDIWREAIPELQRADYGAALERITYRVAERFAAEFGFTLDSAVVPTPPARRASGRERGGASALGVIVMAFVVFALIAAAGRTRGRRSRYQRGGFMRGALPWILLNAMSRGRHSSGWGRAGGWGGSGGGGFGGFGGGGGFSGGGSGGSW